MESLSLTNETVIAKEPGLLEDLLQHNLLTDPALLRAFARASQAAVLTQVGMFNLAIAMKLNNNDQRLRYVHTRNWGRKLGRIFGLDIEVDGKPPQKAALMISNHRSFLDIPVILNDTICAFFSNPDILRLPVFGRAAIEAGTVFTPRLKEGSGRPGRLELVEMIRQSQNVVLECIREGCNIVVFPEGQTFSGPGILPFNSVMFKMAAEMGVEVVPVAVDYKNDFQVSFAGEGNFKRHILGVLTKKRIKAFISYGPRFFSNNHRILKNDVHDWINTRVQAFC